MPRRRHSTEPIGNHLRVARRDAVRTLAQVARATGVNASSLSKFENNHSMPSFDDVSRLAQYSGWPLIFFATGRVRTHNDPRDLAAHLHYWGLRDLKVHPRRPLIGEVRAIEELIAEAADAHDIRIVEAVPGLLLLNDFNPSELLAAAPSRGTIRQVGWLSQVAYTISKLLDINLMKPGAAGRVNRTWSVARSEITRKEAQTATPAEDDKKPALRTSDPIARRWQIESALTLQDFEKRARDILEARR